MQGRECLHCHYLAILLILTDYPDTGAADGFAISLPMGSGQNDLLIRVNQLS